MWAHPGKQLLFMGGEFGMEREWDHDESIDWHLLEDPQHGGIKQLVGDLNAVYRDTRSLWQRDFTPDGFQWIDANDADNNVLSFCRVSADGNEHLVCIANLAPVPRTGFRVGFIKGGDFTEVLNTDAGAYGGTNTGNMGIVKSRPVPWHGLDHSAMLTLPPLGVVWLRG
jgi:1,4-alpha-glucan branching enzyme